MCYCLLEVLDMLEVMHRVLLRMLEALEVPEVMRFARLCMLEAVVGFGTTFGVSRFRGFAISIAARCSPPSTSCWEEEGIKGIKNKIGIKRSLVINSYPKGWESKDVE